jgi:U3 small nucleolar RNA-associated protein 19
LNEWWVPELGIKPPTVKSSGRHRGVVEDGDEDEEIGGDDDDWRKFFDEPVSPSSKAKNNNPAGRLYKMTVHQSLHSLASHRAVFSRAWLALLPRLSEAGKGDIKKRDALAVKALNVMHRGVMPHLTRTVMLMDWVGSCVDYGASYSSTWI